MKNNSKLLITVISILIISSSAYGYLSWKNEQNRIIALEQDYKCWDIEIFMSSPAWELAQAIDEENEELIKTIIKNGEVPINYQDEVYGLTLLHWSVGMNKYNSAKVLLESGANPNTVDYQFGESPLFQATGYFWNDKEFNENPKMLKLLLNHGANPNVLYKGSSKDDFIQSAIDPGTSPLIYSIATFGDKEKTAMLVEAGADINHKTDNDMTATVYALLLDKPEKAHFLIVENDSILTKTYKASLILPGENSPKQLQVINLLRTWIYPLNSKEYEIKMQIVDKFMEQGIDYWSTEIPDSVIETIKQLYPDTWEEYIKVY